MAEAHPGRVGRRLAAIVAADIAGYSRLMSLDEVGTARTLREHRKVTDALVLKHGGRLVKTTGDGVLLEFPSVVDAVECAVAMQAVMAERNNGVPVDRRMLYRIGINLGDILVEGDDILGDGVNVAARLEGIAEPGGICIPSSAYDQVRGKVQVEFADLGEQALKNIARPIRAYAVGVSANTHQPAPLSPLAPRLSIVVLPFANINGGPEQDYFVDGVTESLTTDLSRITGALVIARNTAFTFKGKAVDVKKLGRELNVRYVLEGSVQRGSNRLRLNVQLIDAETGNHLWAERFDKPVGDLFDMQAAKGIAECRQALALDRNLADAHAFIGLGEYELGRGEEVEGHIQEALRLSPRDTRTFLWFMFVGMGKLTTNADLEALDWLRRSIEANPNHALSHFHFAAALALVGDLREARSGAEAGLALDPSFTIRRYRVNAKGDNAIYLARRERFYEGMRIAGVPEG